MITFRATRVLRSFLAASVAFFLISSVLLGQVERVGASGPRTAPSHHPSSTTAARSCSARWTNTDIGDAQPAGSGTISSTGAVTVKGGGTDTWGTADEVHYLWRPVCGQTSISARFTGLTNTGINAEAGLMFRTNTAADAPNYVLLVEPQNGGVLEVTTRTTSGATTVVVSTPLHDQLLPLYLRISRVGTSFSASASSDGRTWTTVPGSTITMTMGSRGALLGGLAVSSFNTTTLATGTFDHLVIKGTGQALVQTSPSSGRLVAARR